ncbi:MAG: methylmalonyl Co-A mutase-associated GTPase MeaB [Candidatus Delongbacteria bacterium]|nr:methylmalonyl Co-A mutase-associated GTPase MeaB [Candidatus Delongbacteria bacterium]
MPDKSRKPEWTPENAGEEFNASVRPGATSNIRSSTSSDAELPPLPELTVAEYRAGVLACDRTLLARAITLIESNLPRQAALARELVQQLLPRSGNSIRIGITGVPGAGKSSFIEVLGNRLLERGHKLAVLAVDPSSSRSYGSILGDKTRMATIARHPDCFIRPSPSGGTLGGVSRKTRETILLCEAAGFDVILVETVGVGQSEIAVRALVDFFLLLTLTGAGDELQGFKKGVMELADAVLVHKADGDNRQLAATVRSDCERILHYFAPATTGWQTPVLVASSLENSGIAEFWEVVELFRKTTTASDVFAARRGEQLHDWMHSLVWEQLQEEFHRHPQVEQQLPELERAVAAGELTATEAASRLINAFRVVRPDPPHPDRNLEQR